MSGLLSDRDICAALDSGRIRIDPVDPSAIQPCSVDVQLGHEFRIFENHENAVIDPEASEDDTRLVVIREGDAFILQPGEFVLASTVERIELADDIASRYEGRSSMGRIGLLSHAAAGFIDPFFRGFITLELTNLRRKPIKLRPGLRIGQLCFFNLTSPADRPYGHPELGSKYLHQIGPTASRLGV